MRSVRTQSKKTTCSSQWFLDSDDDLTFQLGGRARRLIELRTPPQGLRTVEVSSLSDRWVGATFDIHPGSQPVV